VLVEAILEDRLHSFVREAVNSECAGACVFQAIRGAAFCQTHDAEAGSKPLLRVWPALHDSGYEHLRFGAIFSGPPDDPRRAPLKVTLMGLGHVLPQGGKAPLSVAPSVARYPAIVE